MSTSDIASVVLPWYRGLRQGSCSSAETLDLLPASSESGEAGEAWLDPVSCRVVRGDDEIRLYPKDMAVLLALVENAPDAVGRDVLLERVWAGRIVCENVIDQAVSRLRRALDRDGDESSCIETLPRRGYRLLARFGPRPQDWKTDSAANGDSRLLTLAVSIDDVRCEAASVRVSLRLVLAEGD